jgi:hypothetical protein
VPEFVLPVPAPHGRRHVQPLRRARTPEGRARAAPRPFNRRSASTPFSHPSDGGRTP